MDGQTPAMCKQNIITSWTNILTWYSFAITTQMDIGTYRLGRNNEVAFTNL